ncbi:MAG TPA: hypothetical protein VF032_12320 [Thermoleophilaceae bacterium]
MLGPPDGRYVSREAGADDASHVIVLRTQGAPTRGMLRGRAPRRREEGEVEPVPTVRVTVVRAAPFGSADEAAAWLRELRSDKEALEAEAAGAAAVLNRFLRAHRAAAADPWGRDVSAEHALVVRVGYGDGDRVADGRYAAAYELPRARRSSRKREDLAPAERLAAIIGGRDQQLACEELVLRARADLDAGRPREAALQARIALEAVLAEIEEPIDADRAAIGEAANEALRADPAPERQQAVRDAVEEMERVLRRRRLRQV